VEALRLRGTRRTARTADDDERRGLVIDLRQRAQRDIDTLERLDPADEHSMGRSLQPSCSRNAAPWPELGRNTE